MLIKRFENNLPENSSVAFLLSCEDCEKNSELCFCDEVREIISRKDFTGKKGSLVKIPVFGKNIRNIYLVGLGKIRDVKLNLVRDSLAWLFRTAGRDQNFALQVMLGDLHFENLPVALSEAAELCAYEFDRYKSKKDDHKDFALKEIYVDRDFSESEIAKGRIFAQAQIFSRKIANEPGCVINPETLSIKAAELAKECELECEVWDSDRLRAEKMGALLAVGSGSQTPPRLIHLSYKPANPVKKIAFVGKGITFDSGGLDIKPENYMTTMKGDKTGACNVLGIMKGVRELGLNIEVHGFLAAAENMPSGSAFRPDDIVTARNGKTIEINNTDAEGRLVLSDALCVASELKPDVIIDMATLTGACAVALGNWRAGLFVNDDDLASEFLAASERSGEAFWRMPHEDEHIAESLKSPFADLTNCGKRYGGAIFAAIFLSNFVGEEISWAHLDIAGTDFYDKEFGIYSKGASAFGVRTCLEYLSRI